MNHPNRSKATRHMQALRQGRLTPVRPACGEHEFVFICEGVRGHVLAPMNGCDWHLTHDAPPADWAGAYFSALDSECVA